MGQIKNLKTTNTGGMPFVWDDLRFMDAGFTEAIMAILLGYKYREQISYYGTPPARSMVVAGCELLTDVISGDNYVGHREGWVMINGRIYYAPEVLPADGVIYDPTDQYTYWDIVPDQYDPAGSKQFQNGIVHDTYELYRVQLVDNGVQQNKLSAWGGARFLRGLQDPSVRTSVSAILDSSWNQGTVQAFYQRDSAGWISFEGCVSRGSVSLAPIMVMPTGWRPANDVWFCAPNITTGDICIVKFDQSSGNVTISGTNGVGDQISLNGIRFRP